MNMKKLQIAMLTAALGILNSFGAEQSTAIAGATITSLRQGPLRVDSISVINNHPTDSANVYFYDSPTNVLTYVVGAYTGMASYTTNVVRSITNYFGVIRTETNNVVFNYATTVAQSTNTYPLLRTMLSIASSNTVTWTPATPRYLGYGLSATNSATNVVINLTYGNAF